MPISTKPGDVAFASILSGAYASAAIALFFLVADALAGQILHTPSLMGQVVLFDTAPADVTTVRLDALAIYSVVHLVAFIGIGSLVTRAYSRSIIPGSGPGLFVFTLGLLTVGTMAVDWVFYPGIIDAIGRLPLALGNGTAPHLEHPGIDLAARVFGPCSCLFPTRLRTDEASRTPGNALPTLD